MSATSSTLRINLLPEARLAKLRAQQQRQTAGTIATVICILCAVLVVGAYAVTLAQGKHISDLNRDIKTNESQLYGHKDLADMLTLQQHLADLPALYSQRAYLTHFFTIMQSLAPGEISVNTLTFNNTANTLTISGHGKSFAAIDKYVKVLEGGSSVSVDKDGNPYFSSVTINGVSNDSKTSSFNITLTVNSEVTNG